MQSGKDAPAAMIEAMETAEVAVIVLSPEFVARKWPMKELMCFLRRREQYCIANGRAPPIIIPFFYRLKLGELYDEPRLDRRDRDGNLLYYESRFYERQRNGEPEANIANIKEAMMSVHGIMGVRIDEDASNDSSYLMNQRRDIMLVKLCQEIQQAVPTETAKRTEKRRRGSSRVDAFRMYFDAPYEIDELFFDFDSKDKDGNASSQEERLLAMLLDLSQGTNKSIGIRGDWQCRKDEPFTRNNKFAGSQKPIWRRCVRHITRETRGEVIEALSTAVHKSGGEDKAAAMRSGTDVRKAIDVFLSWFATKQCLFVINDVWETAEMTSETVHELLRLHVSGRDSKVLLSTRSVEIASRVSTSFNLEPRAPLGHESWSILLFRYSRIEPEEHRDDHQRVVNEILEQCCGLPLFLAVAGKAVRALSFRRGHERCEAYHIYDHRLMANREGLLSKDVGWHEGLSARLMIAVELLERRKKEFGFRVDLQASEMHRRLCVIGKQTRVPMVMLKHLWELETEIEAAAAAREFEQVGLAGIEIEERECGPIEFLRLHDTVYEFSVAEARKHEEEKIGHETVLRGYERDLTMREGCHEWWHNCLAGDGYIHENVCRHLVGAGRCEELVGLLLSPQWGERQMKLNGILFFETDLLLGVNAIRDGMVDASDEGLSEMRTALGLILEAVTLSSTFIGSNVKEASFQLHGRLEGFRRSYGAIDKYVRWMETVGVR